MKTLIAALFLFPTIIMAQSDSVAVFHRPEKVIIQVNESHAQTSRLSDMMDFLRVEKSFEVISKDQTVKIVCARNDMAASCIFRFLPGKNTTITNKQLNATTALADLKLDAIGTFELYFESSMEDKFNLKISEGKIVFSASKRVLQ